jgi:hypothetical protein
MIIGNLRSLRTTAAAALFCGSFLLFAGCGDDSGSIMAPVDNTGKIAPDFSLLDVNSTSVTHDEQVSPRDYRQKISAWYFGSAT